ncbi:hypothetical protein [Actinospongicola halichondriae]|uniref:hypothetical protein n=1 Tax=Actinospongicola halichondriae TaxID=3236844 RepID=UPI003D5278C1
MVTAPALLSRDDISDADIAREIGNDADLARKAKVAAFVDLPGVPEGTTGKIALVDGWDKWIRYTVLFDNGVDIGSVNRALLVPAKKYAEFDALRTQAIESGAFDKSSADESGDGDGDADAGAGAAAAGGDSPVVNGVTIPAYLIERSKSARERLGA